MTQKENNLTINYLKKLSAQLDSENDNQLSDELKHTESYLHSKGIKQHEGKAIMISADALMVLLEAINGDKHGVNNHVMVDTSIHSERDVVTLLESAVSEAKFAIKSLDNTDTSRGIYTYDNNPEIIAHLSLEDIGNIAVEMEINNELDNTTALTEEQFQNIITKIIGMPIAEIRGSFDYLGDAPAVRKVIEEHVQQVIRAELNIQAK